jgi:polyhydroxybutyrate depolymerase
MLLATIAACSSETGSSRRSATTQARASASAGCRKAAAAPNAVDRTMVSGGVERQFHLTLPANYDGKRPLPVVLGLHALSISHELVAGMVGFGDMAARYDFIGVTPSGRLDGATPFWLAAESVDNYDVQFISDLLDLLEAELCVETARVYSTGMSNGGQMSSLLACRLPKRITAAAPVAGVEFSEQCRGRPVPVIAFHGSADPIVTYDGGGLNATRIADTQFWKGNVPQGLPVHHGVDSAMHNGARHNRCNPTPAEERVSPEVWRLTWRHCKADTILYVIDGGGHAWPGKPVPSFEATFGHGTTEVDASALIFQFFFAQPRGQGARYAISSISCSCRVSPPSSPTSTSISSWISRAQASNTGRSPPAGSATSSVTSSSTSARPSEASRSVNDSPGAPGRSRTSRRSVTVLPAASGWVRRM